MALPKGMEIGVVLPQTHGASWERALGVAQQAEAAGFDSVWVIDHVYGFPPETGILEGWTMLGGLAAATERVGIGAQVLCQSFRNPALLAKMATTLQLMSGGRLRFLVGAGWYQQEYEAFGWPFPSPGERFEQLRDTVRICRGMWGSGDEPFSYDGAHYSVHAVRNVPAPEPVPSLGVGGTGNRVLGLIAEEADEWNCPASKLGSYDERRAVLDAALERHGRQVRRTVQIVFAPGAGDAPAALGAFQPELGLRGSTDQMVQRVGELAEAGVSGLFGMVAGRGAFEAMAEALPELHAAGGGARGLGASR